MTGNYAAGILEGLAHYLPETAAWMDVAGPEDNPRSSREVES